MTFKLATIVLFAGLVSCNSSEEIKEKSGEVTSSISAGSKTEAELIESLKDFEKAELERIEKIKANSTTLKFDKLSHDFGNVLAETDCKTEFIIKNTGNKPLIIEDVSASCGCTMPQKPEAPILPGQEDVIKVVFHSKPGQVNEIKKTITVTANTVEKVHLLEIRAFVKG